MSRLNHEYNPPSRRWLGDDLLNQIYGEIQKQKKKLLNGTDSALMLDAWKNKPANAKYLVFTLRNQKTHQTFLKSAVVTLQTEHGHVIAQHIEDAAKEAKEKYDTNVFSATTDNDMKVKCGAETALLEDDLSLITTTCSSHSGNLLLEAMVDTEFTDRVAEIIKTFKESKLEKYLTSPPNPGTKLIAWPKTRFCYYRNACSSVLKNLNKLREVSRLGDVDLKPQVFNDIHCDDFKRDLESLIETLDPVCTLINTCQNPKSNVADSTQLWLSLHFENNELNNLLQQRIEKAVQPAGYCANLLHHKYRGLLMHEEHESIAEAFMIQYGGNDCHEEYKIFKNSIRNDSVIILWAENCETPFSFWSFCSSRFPNLSKFAMKLMTIPAGTALIESFFSNWTYIHNKYRNRLSDEKSAKLVDIYYSLKYMDLLTVK